MDRTWITIEEPCGIWEAVCIQGAVRNWREPIRHGKKIRKVEAYKPKGEVATSREAVRGAHSTDEVADNKTAIKGRGSASFKSFKGGTSE